MSTAQGCETPKTRGEYNVLYFSYNFLLFLKKTLIFVYFVLDCQFESVTSATDKRHTNFFGNAFVHFAVIFYYSDNVFPIFVVAIDYIFIMSQMLDGGMIGLVLKGINLAILDRVLFLF